ncbi:MAG: protein-arginine deiminase family protein [Pyrinomonadaceae bacterium]
MDEEKIIIEKKETPPQILHIRRSGENIFDDILCPQMYLDMDRDGVPDDIPAEDGWTWGEDGTGAIIPCHLDPKDMKRSFALILFRFPNQKSSSSSGKLECQGKLEIVHLRDKERIRIFDDPSPQGAKQILGDIIEPLEFVFDIKEFQVFGIEATRYDQTEEDQEIELIFTPIVNQMVVEAGIQKAKVRVTPWLMLHHMNTPEKVYCSKFDQKIGNNDQFLLGLNQFAGVEVLEIPAQSQFFQDGLEIGCSYFPASNTICEYSVAYRAPIFLWTEHITPESMQMPVFEVGDRVIDDRDYMKDLMSCGNLEVTPPVKKHPFGRIYYSKMLEGKEFDPKVVNFLCAQKIQKPFIIDASWLEVAHVDEVVTFLPVKSQNDKLVALLPSPRLAFQLLCEVAAAMPDARLLIGRSLRDKNEITHLEKNVWEFLMAGYHKGSGARLLHVNIFGGEFEGNQNLKNLAGQSNGLSIPQNFQGFMKQIESHKIDQKAVTTRRNALKWITSQQVPEAGCYQKFLQNAGECLRNELGKEVEIIEIPVIFYPSEKPGSRAAPLTENMVNMLVLGNRCLFPKPGGPVATRNIKIGNFNFQAGQDIFEQYMIQMLGFFNLQGHPIDDFEAYHSQGGNVHCGTNTLRKSDLTGLKWWQFDPSEK